MYTKILVAVDGSETSLRGLREAINVAKATGGRILLVHVVNELVFIGEYAPASYYDAVTASLRTTGAKLLEESAALVRKADVACETKLVETIGGRTADSLIEQAKAWNADLIVMGTHGRRGLSRLAMGSDAEMVLRMSSVPLLMVRDKPEAA